MRQIILFLNFVKNLNLLNFLTFLMVENRLNKSCQNYK